MDNVKHIEAFRDFFHYGQGAQMRQAYAIITAGRRENENPENIDWDLEEFTFNRLFVGPMAPAAPAVASVYLDPEGLIQGPVTAEIRSLYHSIGLSLEEIGRVPEDSLAYELDACRYLLLVGEELPEALSIYREFVRQHLSAWVPEFCTRAKEHCTESAAVRQVLTSLSEWITKEAGKKTMDEKEME